jgi:hypothetical protein
MDINKDRIERWVTFAKESQKYARQMYTPKMQGYYKGKVAAYMLCARSLKGYETEARTVNARRRRLAA